MDVQHFPIRIFLAILLVVAWSLAFAVGNEGELLFVNTVWPTFQEKCLACHGEKPDDLKGGLNLLNKIDFLAGGDHGQSPIDFDRPESSPLLRSILRNDDEYEAMPPKVNDKLSDRQIDSIRRWIQLGGPWPNEKRLAELAALTNSKPKNGVQVAELDGLTSDWNDRFYDAEDLWAYRPLQRIQLPYNPSKHPIDYFIEAKLGELKIEPAGRADPRALLRRATIDLLGLPAKADFIESFVQNASNSEWEKHLDALLNSSQYGEQMARRWLDVIRYADTCGFANDSDQSNAWRFRDYVIRSFNRDVPYDLFIKQQIAGDELAPDDPEARLATGFLRMGPWEHTGMAVASETRQQWLDDVVNSVGNSFLGLEMSCFRCHDHKFDPLPTRDYYRFQAVFATTQPADVALPFQTYENTVRFEELHAAAKAFADESDKIQRKKIEGLSDIDSLKKRTKRWAKAYEPYACSVYNGPNRKYDTNLLYNKVPGADALIGDVMVVNLLKRGSLADPAEEVFPGVLTATRSIAGNENRALPTSFYGRRLALAEWIANAENPLAARVYVNRIWAWHFGNRGLVATPNNFGAKGAKPSHPELLDWLTQWFIDHQWSTKALHRLIMTSETYCRTATVVDRSNIEQQLKEYAVFPVRRLAAEEIRDSMLAVSGELNREAGGPPSRPQMNWQAAAAGVRLMGGIDIPWRPSLTPTERNRRTIYAMNVRGRRDPFLEVFDQPSSERSCEARMESIIVPQAITLINGDFVNDRSLAMAKELSDSASSPNEQLQIAFRRVYGRAPTTEQRQQCIEFYRHRLKHHRATEVIDPPLKEWIQRISLNDEDFDKNYIPDIRPSQLSPRIRAMADICLVLLNSNEFLYQP